MTFHIPPNGTYRRIRDGVHVEVVGCTGNASFADTVAVQGDRLSRVRLENFWKKYEPAHTEETPRLLLRSPRTEPLQRCAPSRLR